VAFLRLASRAELELTSARALKEKNMVLMTKEKIPQIQPSRAPLRRLEQERRVPASAQDQNKETQQNERAPEHRNEAQHGQQVQQQLAQGGGDQGAAHGDPVAHFDGHGFGRPRDAEQDAVRRAGDRLRLRWLLLFRRLLLLEERP
jgi:hypothetical protein